jgi:uncharacterized protein YciI
MKRILTLIIMLLIAGFSFSQTNPDYNKPLADSLGADENGMKAYILVILKTGTNTTSNKPFVDSCFDGHMMNIDKLAKEGKLTVAGPISKNEKTYRGIFILNVSSIAEAEKLVQTDPAISQKLLAVELYKWYGSAALPMYLPYHDKVSKIKL